MPIQWKEYTQKITTSGYDEMITKSGKAHNNCKYLLHYLSSLTDEELQERQNAADLAILAMGITFTVYDGESNIERIWPFDIIPRIISANEWQQTEQGLNQRLTALNMFIADIYDQQQIIKDKVFPAELLAQSTNFRPECVGFKPAMNIWAHICGSDLVRDADGTLYVLEDNLRIPSGVSYMLENRLVTKRVFPELFTDHNIQPVDGYLFRLYDMLTSLSPRPDDEPVIVVLTPGSYNSAYFEHSFLAQHMGVYLVEGRDLLVADDDCVYMRTVEGLERVDVIYRRVDDLFLDPEIFNPDSMLGVPGLMRAWQKGTVALANAPGAGVADDKAVYAYVPQIIKYYLDQEPIIQNVPTQLCMYPKERKYILDNLHKLVIKPANESGGYGMLVGPHSSSEQCQQFAKLIEHNPRNYIAQPTLNLSTSPTICDGKIAPRHLDLRPFILSGKQQYVTHGGLTRVALKEGSLVVNSSQGGGSKDTWIVNIEE